MTTPVSGLTPYCTVSQFLDRFDWRTVGDLVSDLDTRIELPTLLLSGGSYNTRLTSLLQEASGRVEVACFRGDRYQLADLQNLATGAGAGSNGALLLAGMVAGITMWLLWERRPVRLKSAELPLRAQEAVNMLDALEAGDKVFPFQEVMDAGNPSPVWQTAADVQARNNVTNAARRYFGNLTTYNVPGQTG